MEFGAKIDEESKTTKRLAEDSKNEKRLIRKPVYLQALDIPLSLYQSDTPPITLAKRLSTLAKCLSTLQTVWIYLIFRRQYWLILIK